MLEKVIFTATRSDNPIDANTAGDQGDPKKVTEFVTIQSLSFPFAVTIVSGIWEGIQSLTGSWADEKWLPAVIAALVVAAVYLASWTELGHWSKKASGFIIAGLNAALLWLAAIGVNVQLFG